MSDHRREAAPADMMSPSNPIIIQCQIGPDIAYKNPMDSDYLAPPFTLAFARDESFSAKKVKESRGVKRTHDHDVHKIVCNAYDMGGKDRALQNSLRCIGVTYDGVMDMLGAKSHSREVGRLAVIVSGACSILCNKEDLEKLTVGDLLQWEPRDNGLIYSGLPDTFSTVRISRYHGSIRSDDISAIYGPERVFMEGPGNNLKLLKGQCNVMQSNSDQTQFTFEQISRVAIIMFRIYFDKEVDETSWVDELYDPKKDTFVGFPRPTSKSSPLWADHCFGTEGKEHATEVITTAVEGWCFKIANGTVGPLGPNGLKTKLRDWMDMSESDLKKQGKYAYLLVKVLKTRTVDAEDLVTMNAEIMGLEFNQSETDKAAQFLSGLTTYHGHVNTMAFIQDLARNIVDEDSNISNDLFEQKVVSEVANPNSTIGQFLSDVLVAIQEFFTASSSGVAANIYYRRIAMLNFDFHGIDREQAKNVISAASKIGIEEFPREIDEDGGAVTPGISTGVAATGSRVFGMLLEKYTKSNEARILLTPGMS